MKFELKYHNGLETVQIPDHARVSLLQPKNLPALDAVSDDLTNALENPLGCDAPSEQLARKNQPKIAIAIPDETRPTPVKTLLPIVIEQLHRSLPKLDPSAITIVIGGGLHPPPESKARIRIDARNIGPGCTIVAHDANRARMKDFGTTSRGTPVRINEAYAESDLKIVIGQIDPHQFVGFTGGSKGVAIGCAAPETIQHNHSLMFEKSARAGCLEGNPVREDINEARRRIGIDFAVNVVLNGEKQIVGLFAGDPEAVLKKGADICKTLYGVENESKFDIAMVSCGGSPKDVNLYQAQKGLNLASDVVKRGGKILLLAACPQGIGDDAYSDYVVQHESPEVVLKDFKALGFRMGAHKAYLFAKTLVDYDVAVFSELDTNALKLCQLTKASNPSGIIKKWVEESGRAPRVAIIPYANTTYFYQP